MSRPIQATVSVSALRPNYAVAKRAALQSKVFAVVKANAYGHGIERVTRARVRADGFATVELDGAVATRERGFAEPILLLEGFFAPAELPVIAAADLAVAVHGDEQLRMLEAWRPARPLDVFFKINTGMNRLGFSVESPPGQLQRLRSSGVAKSITLMAHFATADRPHSIEEAMRRLNQATHGIDLARSLANTPAIFAHPETHPALPHPRLAPHGA